MSPAPLPRELYYPGLWCSDQAGHEFRAGSFSSCYCQKPVRFVPQWSLGVIHQLVGSEHCPGPAGRDGQTEPTFTEGPCGLRHDASCLHVSSKPPHPTQWPCCCPRFMGEEIESLSDHRACPEPVEPPTWAPQQVARPPPTREGAGGGHQRAGSAFLSLTLGRTGPKTLKPHPVARDEAPASPWGPPGDDTHFWLPSDPSLTRAGGPGDDL